MSDANTKRGYGPNDNFSGGSSWMEFLLSQATLERNRQIAEIKTKIAKEPLEIISKNYKEVNSL
ncbi:MAG: hypothetical protein J6O61_01595 [Butyrivibrio sp.]|uniref:hypothetical protein n=1 Tax=Butyrivibrio sp. TaxID=28121 RepID=UPI001B1B047B|nr:hypothetical protein [Butyrivibrio sp.]MBO6239528.1 hypothetical protein [Butyrivibrio sp.]